MDLAPSYVAWTFFGCVITCLGFIHYAFVVASRPRKNITPLVLTTGMLVWIVLVSMTSFFGFFLDFNPPPRLPIFVGLITVLILVVMVMAKTRDYILKMPLTTLTYIHIVRVPVEIVLWWLFLKGSVPGEITFEGSNLDILSGISAPFAGVFLVGAKSKSRIAAIIWNLLTLGLLLNVVFRAMASTPYFQESGIQTMAVFYFPYVLLPTFIVPIVLFSHIASLAILFQSRQAD